MENGTSFFTQRLVDGLVGAATDQDGDGYVTFSDIYAYVDRRLREAGKQIPQRRVDGDGDVPLAKRALPAQAEVAADTPPPENTVTATGPEQAKGKAADSAPPAPAATAPVADDGGPAGTASAAGGTRPGKARRNVLLAAAAVAVMGGVIATLVLVVGSSGGNSQAGGSSGTSSRTFTATAPWRLKIQDNGYGNGCSLTYIDTHSGNQHFLADSLYDTSTFQISDTGTFRWRVNDPRCNVVPLSGTGTTHLPFTIDQSGAGDSEVFTAPAKVAVHVKNWHGDASCDFRLYDPANGDQLDFATATQGQNDTVTLDSSGRQQAYLALSSCGVQVSAGH